MSHSFAQAGGFFVVPLVGGVALRAAASVTKPKTIDSLATQALVAQVLVAGAAYFAMEHLGKDSELGSFAHGGVWGASLGAGILGLGLVANQFPPTALDKGQGQYEMAAPRAKSSEMNAILKLLAGGAV